MEGTQTWVAASQHQLHSHTFSALGVQLRHIPHQLKQRQPLVAARRHDAAQRGQRAIPGIERVQGNDEVVAGRGVLELLQGQVYQGRDLLGSGGGNGGAVPQWRGGRDAAPQEVGGSALAHHHPRHGQIKHFRRGLRHAFEQLVDLRCVAAIAKRQHRRGKPVLCPECQLLYAIF